jgi:hypothetical protein
LFVTYLGTGLRNFFRVGNQTFQNLDENIFLEKLLDPVYKINLSISLTSTES